jgi:hypothetical protein
MFIEGYSRQICYYDQKQYYTSWQDVDKVQALGLTILPDCLMIFVRFREKEVKSSVIIKPFNRFEWRYVGVSVSGEASRNPLLSGRPISPIPSPLYKLPSLMV